jgi:hypothetical protein
MLLDVICTDSDRPPSGVRCILGDVKDDTNAPSAKPACGIHEDELYVVSRV